MGTIAAIRNCTYQVTVKLIIWECPVCGIVYGIPDSFRQALHDEGGYYFCPNGHKLGWDETKADRERKKREQVERELRYARDSASRLTRQRNDAKRSAAAYKGHLTRARSRIANGICPVPGCKRSGFDRVMSHIASKHPDWLHQHADGLGR